MAALEFNFPHVLAHRMAPYSAAGAEGHVIVHLPICNQGAGVFVLLAVRPIVPSRALDRRGLGDEMISLHAPHHFRTELNRFAFPRIAAPGIYRPLPSGDSV